MLVLVAAVAIAKVASKVTDSRQIQLILYSRMFPTLAVNGDNSQLVVRIELRRLVHSSET